MEHSLMKGTGRTFLVKNIIQGGISYFEDNSPNTIEEPELSDDAKEFLNQARAMNTKRAYAFDLIDFFTWCFKNSLCPCPAAPETISNYISYLARRRNFRASTIERRMAAISQLHKAKDYESPTSHPQVRNIWKGIKRDNNVQVSRVGKSPLLIEEIRRMANVLVKEGNLKALRDRTLIVIGFAGAFRRSELVALNVDDVDIVHEGLVITIRKSKTDQEGHQRKIHLPYGSHVETCPVRTYQEWLNKSGILTGPIFLRVYRQKRKYVVSSERLSDKGVARVIKETAQKVGLPPAKYAGHSLRSGFITSAAKGGAREDKIMAISGHKSILVMRSYIRDANGFDQNAASYVGL